MAEIRKEIGKRVWAIAEGWIPQGNGFTDRALASHETAASSTPATTTRTSS
jgi:hypothetical protein